MMLWQYTKQNAVDLYNQRQLRQLEEIVERMRVRKRLEAGEKHKTGSPPEPSGAGSGGERRSGAMGELCRLRRSEGYEARDDEKQD